MGSSNSQQTSKGSILIVDDSWEHLQALSATLSQYGYAVRGLITGAMVLEVAKLALPDLILLDIKMPDIDGYEVCQQLKADEATRHIPVIFLSVYHDVFDKVKAFKIGAVDYITKPFQAEEVLVRVENQITIQKLQQQLKKQNEQLLLEMQECQRIEAARQLREQYLTALVEVQHRLLSFDDSNKCYQDIMPILGGASKASRVYVFENHYADDGKLLMSQRAEWCAEGINSQINNPILQNLPYEEYFPRWADLLPQGKIIAGIVAELPPSEREILEPQGILSILILPIIAKGEFLGFIGFDNCIESRLWEASEIAFLQAVGGAISIAYERYKSDLELQQQLERSNILRKITNKIRSELDTENIIKTAAKQIGEALGVSRALIHSYVDSPTPQIHIFAEFLAPGCTSLSHYTIPVSGNPHAQQLLAQDQAIGVNNVYTYPLLENAQELCREYNIKSILAVRTSYNSQANGMVCLHQCDRYRDWSPEEIELLESIAAQLGIALAQAKLLEQEKQARIKLEQEIRDRLNAEAALKASESKYRHLVETSRDIIWSVDTSGCITYVNSAVKQILGYEQQEMIGRCFTEFVPPAQLAQDLCAFECILNGESIFEYETIRIGKDGNLVYLIFNAIAVEDEEGKIVGVTGTATNITERKRAEQALTASADKLRNHNLVLTQLAKNQVLYQGDLKAALRNITEVAAKNIEVERVSIWLYDETRTQIQCLDLFEKSSNRHSDGGSLVAADYPSYFQVLEQDQPIVATDAHTDSRTKEFSESYLTPLGITAMLNTPVKLEGMTVGVLCLEHTGTTRDWTAEDQNFARSLSNLVSLALEARERLRTFKALRESEAKLASAFRSSPDPITLTTFPEIRYIEVNDSFCRFFGYSRSQVIDRNYRELNIWVNQEECTMLTQVLRHTKAIRNHEVEFRTANGELKTTLFSAELIEIDGQQYLLGTAHDITERKQAENESRLLLVTTQAISRAVDVKDALALVLRLICTTIDWDFAEAWIPNANGTALEYSLGWYGSHNNLEEFYQYTEVVRLEKGMGLLGRVWRQQKPEWIEDVSQVTESAFVRTHQAAQVGLKAGFAVPILADNQVVAVLAFFKSTSHALDRRLLYLVGAVAAQLGALIQRKQVEAAHRQSEERLQLALEASDLGLWDWNIKTGKVYRDWRWKKMLGYEAHEITDDSYAFGELVHPDDAPVIKSELDAYLRGESPVYEVEFRLRSKSGEWKWIQSCAQVFERDESGEPLRMTGTHKDITERKTLERELALREARLNAFFSCAPVGLTILDEELRYVQVNEVLASINGMSQSEHIGKTLWEIVPDVAPVIASVHKQVMQTGKPVLNIELSTALPLQPGIIRHFLTSYFPILGEDNHPASVGTVVIEITDRKHTELALQESQRRYQTLAEASPVGIFHTDSHGKYLYVNQRFSEITGLASKADLDKYWHEIIHIDDRDRVFAEWQETISTKKPFYSEYRFVHTDGRVIWVIGQALPEFGDDGEFKGYIGTVTDITERKFAEDALRESADRERAIAQVIQRMRQTLDLATIFSATTQELRQVLNCDRVVVYRFNPDWSGEFVAESVASGWGSLIEQQQDQPHLREITTQNERCTVTTLNSGDNQVLDTYLQQTQGGVYTRGASFLCVPDIYTAGFDPCYINLLERFQVRAYITVPIFCGNQLWGLLASYQNSSSRQWKKGEINIVVQIGNQLGVALQQAELLARTQKQSSALQKAVIAADAANRAKSEFLANMSHELRTPLNAILGFTQIMSRDSTLSSENKQNLTIINRAGEHLLNLINDILEMSKIEAGRTTLNLSSFDLIYLLDNLQEMLHIRAVAKGLKLVFEYAPEIPRYVRTDSSKLRQVLLNVLGNAIKFTETGSVKLRVFLPDENKDDRVKNFTPSQKLHLCFEIQDTGPGISPEEIDLLFQAFGQTEAGRKSQQGTGLGLAISRKYVQLMGGEINVSSTVGVGSVFSFYIQIGIASVDEIQTTTSVHHQVIGIAPNEPEYRILVVDDANDSRLLLVKLLSSIGFSVREATNGKEAISIWESWLPDLILMDMRMPIMDGYEATREIKRRERQDKGDMRILRRGDGENVVDNFSASPTLRVWASSSSTIIIALTANAFEEQRQAMISAGCDDFINKPFREELLLEKLSQYLGVKYLYQQESHLKLSQKQTNTETLLNSIDIVSLLSKMPSEWLTKVHYAAAQCSDDLILDLLEQIPPEKSLLINFLSDLAENFQFEKIMELINLSSG
ncbi:histidine kinase [Fischerella thermalis CCMEE 5205]|nr:histidine kinase [Fischerella thermalis CCMEE 5205]